jgi:negative regulator of sigma E activity
VPSVSHTLMRPVAVAACACLLAVGAAGCSTTQEKAAAKQAESTQILKEQAAAKKQAKLKAEHKKHHADHAKPKGEK